MEAAATRACSLALGTDCERSLLMSIREALHNALRHGAPKNLKVILSFDRVAVDIQIDDDGCGFDPSTIRFFHGHYGLIGMQERVEKLGGEFHLTSAPGAGTRVRLTIPAIKSAATEHRLNGDPKLGSSVT